MALVAGQPILILKEGTQRVRGKDARRSNIAAAKVIGEAIRTTLGPKGMDKMIVDSLGDVTITNDGATILDEIDVEHPAAKVMVELAKSQDNEAGDGTTTVVVLASEFLGKAEDILNKNIHPSIIIKGYEKAAEKSQEILEKLTVKVSPDDEETLKKIAMTAMHGKSTAEEREYLAGIAVRAVKNVAEKRGDKIKVDIDNIKILKKQGKSLRETKLVQGMVLDKEVVHAGMPKLVKNAKIALIRNPLEIEKTEINAEIHIRDPEQMKSFLDEETKMLKTYVEKIKKVGANVVFCQMGIDDMAQHFLAKEGILAVRRVSSKDMAKLAKATGGKTVTNIEDLSEKDLGYAEEVREEKIGDDKMVFIEGCKNPKANTILIRGGAEHVVDEAERAIHDALSVVKDVIEDGTVVPGGGAVETQLAMELRNYAPTIGGKEQIAIEAYADALEIIPRTLAENAGLDPVEIMVNLKSKHGSGEKNAGLEAITGKVEDMVKLGIIEPWRVKSHAIKSATEATKLILRIDDVIAAKAFESEKTPGSEKGGEESETE